MAEPKFHFETIPLPLNDGTFVDLATEADQRWLRLEQSAYRAAGNHYSALYHLKDGRYLQVKYQVHRWDGKGWMWSHSEVGFGEFHGQPQVVHPLYAAGVLIEWQEALPEDLRNARAEAMKPKPELPPRPLSHWCARNDRFEGRRITKPDKPLLVKVVLQELLYFAVEFLLVVRRGFKRCEHDEQCLLFLESQLNKRYYVDPEKWVGDRDTVPPASFRVTELPELKDATGVRFAIDRLSELLKPVIGKNSAFWVPLADPDLPTAAEAEAFPGEVDALLPDLEIAVGELQKAVNYWIEKANAPAPTPPPAPRRVLKEPSKDDFTAYRVWAATGATHDVVTETLAKVHKIIRVRGTVTKMIKRVSDWLEAGNVLPPLPARQKRSKPMDPSKIDMGKKQGKGKANDDDEEPENK
ncbi:hypothetical protein ETAA8_39480 [Anatilimnocola aggregata]|uniref:Uncharacterized protein n=1 Tax=Anatilimnocola aggregata TaxID=2528021 RepID=A0A517YF32_9BACT|nr:hypothetical protein [Anatilimnocola aggregata]QDU28843.1 hypothetical protein ETAA8_39480 [Anatilimnocola aggregata]